MSLIKSVESIAKGTVGTAVSAARHPVSTTANVIGFAKGVAGAGIGLVRGPGDVPQQRAAEPAPETVTETEEVPETVVVTPAPERDLPGPDIVLAEPPAPEDLPEPIVIEAEDTPDPGVHESFHHEPHATTRAETIGGEAGDLFEAEDEADEALEDLTRNQ